MFTYQRLAGTTDVSVIIRIIDAADGTPEIGVVFNTAGMDLQYRREGAASVAITEVTLAALTTAHTDGGFLHIGNGYYRLDLPDAACAAGSVGVLVHGTVTGMVVIGCYVQLVAYNPFDAVRLGLTALPNAAANAAGGLPISAAGGLNLDTQRSDVAAILVDTGTTLQAELDGIQADTEDIQTRIPAALVGGRIDATIDATGMEAGAVAAIADGVWDEDIDAAHQTANTAGKRLDDASSTVATNLDATTSSRASQISVDTIDDLLDTEVAAILADTNELQTDWADGGRLDLILDARASQASIDTISTNVDDIETRVTLALPASAPGATGGLATFDNVFALADLGTVNDAGPAVGDFDGDTGLTATDDFYNGALLVFTTGALKGIARKISDYVGTSRNLAFTGAADTADAPFPTAPANGDSFVILGRHGA